jgi:hypothetical protein
MVTTARTLAAGGDDAKDEISGAREFRAGRGGTDKDHLAGIGMGSNGQGDAAATGTRANNYSRKNASPFRSGPTRAPLPTVFSCGLPGCPFGTSTFSMRLERRAVSFLISSTKQRRLATAIPSSPISFANTALRSTDGLTQAQRDTTHMITRMLDDLYWVMSYSRWEHRCGHIWVRRQHLLL